MYQLAVGGNATPGAECAGNCSVSPDGLASLCWTEDDTWGFCRHVLEIVLYPYQFGRARVMLFAVDAHGGRGEGGLDLEVQLLNHPPVFTVPALLLVNEVKPYLHPRCTDTSIDEDNYTYIKGGRGEAAGGHGGIRGPKP